MPLSNINSVTLRPDRTGDFQERVADLAGKARASSDPWRWTAHQTLFGDVQTIHFAAECPDFAAIQELGTVQGLWHRVLGEKDGEQAYRQTNACVQGVQQTVSIDRPDLSYPPEGDDRTAYPFALITSARARPGQAEAAEELIRKVAEAIPKVGDPARIIANQSLVGELGVYWVVRPLRSLADLDEQTAVPDLLTRAFGNGEGGLIWRAGSEAMEQVRREILAYVPELSNPPTD